jgi:heme/copper-type cytochrome/quinol oxidase subunit 2
MVRRMSWVALFSLLLVACGVQEESFSPAPIPTTTSSTEPTATETTGSSPTTAREPTTTTEPDPEITVVAIETTGGAVEVVQRFDVPLNELVRVVVTADVTDEIHVHGYDLHADISPGFAAVLEFVAHIPGVFEIELEESGALIAELKVAP